jgi:hypothetical protein
MAVAVEEGPPGGDIGIDDDTEADGCMLGLVETAMRGEREPETYKGGLSPSS